MAVIAGPDLAPPPALVAEAMPAAERAAQIKVGEQAYQVVSDLMNANPWQTKASFEKLMAFCGQQRSAFDASAPWDGVKQTNPFTHPDFLKSLLQDRVLLDRLVYQAVEGNTEKHFAAQDIVQNLLRGLMREYAANSGQLGTPALGLAKGEEINAMVRILQRISPHLNFARGGEEHDRAGVFFARVGYDEDVLESRARHEYIRKSRGDFSFTGPFTPVREELAAVVGQELSDLMLVRQGGKKAKNGPEVFSRIAFLRAYSGQVGRAASALVDVVQVGTDKEARAAGEMLASVRKLGPPDYERLLVISRDKESTPYRKELAAKLLASIPAPAGQEGKILAANTGRPGGLAVRE